MYTHTNAVPYAKGHNIMYTNKYFKYYSEDNYLRAQYIRDIRIGHLGFDTRDITHKIVYYFYLASSTFLYTLFLCE